MYILPLEVLILKRVTLLNVLQICNHYIPVLSKISVPFSTYICLNILQDVLLRLHTDRRPFVGIVIPSKLILLKYICSLSLECLTYILKHNL